MRKIILIHSPGPLCDILKLNLSREFQVKVLVRKFARQTIPQLDFADDIDFIITTKSI